MGRKQGCVIKSSATTTPTTTNGSKKKVMPHDEFMQRIRKSLYFGHDFCDEEFNSMQVSKPLAEYASELFSDTHRGHSLNRLTCVEASSVQTATPAALIMALVYLDRLNITDPGYVRRITPQELFIVSMIISTKFYAGYDEDIYLSDWAEDGHMSEDRLKQLELEFLAAIEWNIYISNEQFFDKLTCIEKTLARREGLKRGWLTYAELMQLLPSFTLAKFLLNNVTVMAVSYAASVMTIAGAFFLAAQIPGTSLHRSSKSLATAVSQSSNPNDLLTIDPEIRTANAAINASTETSSVVIMRQHNQTTSIGLNVEDELLKLERQYREEAILERAIERQNEIPTESRLTLPQQQLMAKLNVNQKCAKQADNLQLRRGDWYAHKQKYADYDLNARHLTQIVSGFHASLIKHSYESSPQDLWQGYKESSYKDYRNNSMTSLWWHILQDTIKQSAFMRLPFVWLKFM